MNITTALSSLADSVTSLASAVGVLTARVTELERTATPRDETPGTWRKLAGLDTWRNDVTGESRTYDEDAGQWRSNLGGSWRPSAPPAPRAACERYPSPGLASGWDIEAQSGTEYAQDSVDSGFASWFVSPATPEGQALKANGHPGQFDSYGEGF